MSTHVIPAFLSAPACPHHTGQSRVWSMLLESTAILLHRFWLGRCPISHPGINSIAHHRPTSPGIMASLVISLRKTSASQPGGNLFARRDSGLYLLARVQITARLHLNCNLKRRCTIKLTPSIQVERYQLEER